MTKLITDADNEVFESVSKIATELRTLAVKNATFKPSDWYSERLLVLTGSYMYLCTRYAQLKSGRENNEVSFYIQCKNDLLKMGEKITVSAIEKEARASVNDFVEAEKVMESYQEATNQAILTCKKILDVLMIELQREAK
jgi:hypothetical protein